MTIDDAAKRLAPSARAEVAAELRLVHLAMKRGTLFVIPENGAPVPHTFTSRTSRFLDDVIEGLVEL